MDREWPFRIFCTVENKGDIFIWKVGLHYSSFEMFNYVLIQYMYVAVVLYIIGKLKACSLIRIYGRQEF